MANSIYLISQNMILTDYYKLLPTENYVYEHLVDLEVQEVISLKDYENIETCKILSQITAGDLTIFNHEQIIAACEELENILPQDKLILKLKCAFKYALGFPHHYLLIDY